MKVLLKGNLLANQLEMEFDCLFGYYNAATDTEFVEDQMRVTSGGPRQHAKAPKQSLPGVTLYGISVVSREHVEMILKKFREKYRERLFTFHSDPGKNTELAAALQTIAKELTN